MFVLADTRLTGSPRGHDQAGAMTTDPLWPPNPKLFEIEGPGVQGRGSPTTRSISMSSSGAVVFAVGGISPCWIDSTQRSGLEGAGGAERMAGHAFGRDDRDPVRTEDVR